MDFIGIQKLFTEKDLTVGGIDYAGRSFNVYMCGNTCAAARVYLDTDGFVIVLDLTKQGIVCDWNVYSNTEYHIMVGDCIVRWEREVL